MTLNKSLKYLGVQGGTEKGQLLGLAQRTPRASWIPRIPATKR